MIKKNSTLLFITVLTSCTCPDFELKNLHWKYGSGYYLGDYIRFDEKSLRNDTLFGKDKTTGIVGPYAVIVSTQKIYFIGHSEIEIKSLKTGEIGTYFGK
jgi:hypothetical protein